MKFKILIACALSVLVIACKDKPQQKEAEDSGLIVISKAQFASEKMMLGEPSLQPFADRVPFTGVISPAINGQVSISLPLPGIVDKVYYSPGQKVSKGAVLFDVSGQWFIDKQKDLAESSAVLAKLESDYNIAKALYDENIGTIKDYTAAQSRFFAENARYKALKKLLGRMGLEVGHIEKGTFYASFAIKAPISGYLSRLYVGAGQYLDPQQSMAEIIDPHSLQLKLSVFGKDLKKIAPGQNVIFYLNADKTESYEATLHTIGKMIRPETKSVACYASIEELDTKLMVSNLFVEGEIYTAVDTTWAVPQAAILASENEDYILLLEKEDDASYYFRTMKIDAGRISNHYVELTEQPPLRNIVLRGVYNITIE